MRVQDVTPEYVRDIRALGLKPRRDEIITMRVQGVTRNTSRRCKRPGFKLDVERDHRAKVQDVTPSSSSRHETRLQGPDDGEDNSHSSVGNPGFESGFVDGTQHSAFSRR